MSKIYLIGDSHIGLGYPNSVDKWFKVHKEYFSEFLITLLKSRVKEGDIIMHLGDLFDNRNVIPINILNYGMDIVEEIAKIAPFHIIVGNHDCWSKSSDEINTIRPFKWVPNVFIYDKTSQIEYNGLKLCLMPYIEKRLEQINLINTNKNCDYLFCHSDLNGCRMHLTSVGHRNSDKIDVEDFKFFKRVFSAHIHIRQVNRNFEFIGSNFQMDRNDYGDQKGITVLDTNTGETEFIPNNISPVFKKVRITNEGDIEILEKLKDSKDYIDIAISNNLLISNRKLRRKL
jgi:DNA repair exonuclease SbcCD nuclease subunit